MTFWFITITIFWQANWLEISLSAKHLPLELSNKSFTFYSCSTYILTSLYFKSTLFSVLDKRVNYPCSKKQVHCGSVNMTGGSAETDSGLDFSFLLFNWMEKCCKFCSQLQYMQVYSKWFWKCKIFTEQLN